MSHSPLFKKAVKAINEEGALLVFPINNKKEPSSVWSALWPKSKMRWEWDESADNRVVQLWYLKEELSRSGDIVYSKWYQGRATCFSKEVFKHMMAVFRAQETKNKLKISESREILEALEMDSPLSTKQIKEAAGLQGKSFEGHYNKAMKALWIPGLIAGFGEVQDSSFPSLAVGATSVLFEELWLQAAELDPTESLKWLEKKLGAENLFFKFMLKQLKQTSVVEDHPEL